MKLFSLNSRINCPLGINAPAGALSLYVCVHIRILYRRSPTKHAFVIKRKIALISPFANHICFYIDHSTYTASNSDERKLSYTFSYFIRRFLLSATLVIIFQFMLGDKIED